MWNLVQVELTNAAFQLVRARNGLKSGFANLNRAMGVTGAEDYVLEDLPIEVRTQRPLDSLMSDSLSHPGIPQGQGTDRIGRSQNHRHQTPILADCFGLCERRRLPGVRQHSFTG